VTEQEREQAMALLEQLDRQLADAQERVEEARYDVQDIERRIQLTRETFPEIRYAKEHP
jgi:hypothetical protein